MKQAIVVGGSGMLAKTSLWLAENNYRVSVIGRNQDKLNKLVLLNNQINPVSVDYSNYEALGEELDKILKEGEVELVVAWIHSVAPRALETIINKINSKSWKLFHTLGSSSNLEAVRKQIIRPNGCEYHQVQLGCIIEENRKRWLTNDEIANGVIEAIRLNKNKHVVGTIAP